MSADLKFNTTFRNWGNRRFRSFGALLVAILLRIGKLFMPAPQAGIEKYIARSRHLVNKLDRWMPAIPERVGVEKLFVGSTPAYWVRAPGVSSTKAMLYLQGGGLILGSPMTTHRDLIWRLSAACNVSVLAIEYSLVPEHCYPIASEQALSAWQFLLEGFPAHSLVLAGDSAGGNLALSTALRIRDIGLLSPAALCLLSPETDLTASGPSVKTNLSKDNVIPGDAIRLIGELYADGESLEHPYISPYFGDFHGFPPTLFQVGSGEVFLDDSVRVAEKMRISGVPVQLDVWKGMPHVWHGFAGFLPEARAAIDDIGRFVRSHLRDDAAPPPYQ